MTNAAAASLIFTSSLLVFFAGCSAPADSDASAESNEADVSGSIAGHYVLASGSAESDVFWINEVNLHKDGTFEGNFGSSVSNLSGHFYWANGTYTTASTAQGRVIRFAEPNGTSELLFKATATGLQLKSTGETSDPWFAMDKAAAPVTVNFPADGSLPPHVALHKNDTVLVRYPAARAKCTGKDAIVTALGEQDLPQPQFVIGVSAVKGTYDFLIPAGDGTHLTLWFEGSSSGCTAWDSNAGHNFVFDVE